MKTDILIIGAGLAGCTCAYLLAEAGYDVTLLERTNLQNKSKLCAGLIPPRAESLLVSIFGERVEELFKERFDTLVCVAGDHRETVHGISMKSLLRNELDSLAASSARDAGANVVDRFFLHRIDFENCIMRGANEDRRPFELEYRILVGADGAVSQVRRLSSGVKPHAALSLEAEVPNNGASLTIACRKGLRGYSWFAPVGDVAKIGCVSYKDNCDLKAELGTFARECGIEFDGDIRGAFIPTGDDICLRRGNVRFIGDAAGLICPPSGEGIYHALHSASMLARAIESHASYEALMKSSVIEIERQHRMMGLFYSDSFMNAGLTAAGLTPYGKERALKFALRHFCSYDL